MTELTTSIKKVDDEAWRLFKMEAARHDMQLGEFFSHLVKDHRDREAENNWDSILEGKPIIARKQAKDIRKHTKTFRKGFEFKRRA